MDPSVRHTFIEISNRLLLQPPGFEPVALRLRPVLAQLLRPQQVRGDQRGRVQEPGQVNI